VNTLYFPNTNHAHVVFNSTCHVFWVNDLSEIKIAMKKVELTTRPIWIEINVMFKS